MITINANLREPIFLRHAGEENALRVAFDLQEFEAHWPGGVPALLVRRPISSMDAAAYPVPLSVDGMTAFWTVSASDTECSGYGKAQLQWRVGGTLAKSCVYDTVCAPSLLAGDAPPDAPSKAWFEAIQAQIGDLSKLTTKAKENLVAAINEAARTGGGSGGGTIEMRVSGGYIQYSNDGVTWENLIAVSELKGDTGPQGIQGLKGDPGKDGATGPAGKDGLTPTIGANGNWYLGDIDTQKPSRGEKGDPGAKGADGAPGKDGSDGYSPEATVTQINGGAKIIIKDRNGTTSANVMNGAQGPKGDAGPQGDVGPKGDSYTLTTADKSEIAGEVVAGGVQAELGDEPVSLGITGATPGQIAKITAVDETGKPTAWEPVDMAGGGGSPAVSSDWTLLADITLSEDSAVIKIDKTSAGDSFSIRELAIFGEVKCDTVNKTLTLSLNGKIGYGNPTLSLGEVLNAAETGAERLASYIEVLPECVFCRTQHNPYNTTMDYNTPFFGASPLRMESQAAYAPIGNPLTVFALSPWSGGKSGVFKAGTSLKFYGRE